MNEYIFLLRSGNAVADKTVQLMQSVGAVIKSSVGDYWVVEMDDDAFQACRKKDRFLDPVDYLFEVCGKNRPVAIT